jgi:phospho-N-acetylmuramoyl-pentapeptide-transferase
MYKFIGNYLSEAGIAGISMAACFLITYLVLKFPPAFLPKDQGRAFAVNGALSKGKTRGVGILFVSIFLICGLIFLPMTREYAIYGGLVYLMMLSGYLDDASENPWSDYKKGAIDLVLSVLTVVNFLMCNPSDIRFFDITLHLPPMLYAVLGVMLIWLSVNVTNCSDGVDGLCGSVALVAFVGYALIFIDQMPFVFRAGTLCFAAALLAYLRFNWHPSTMLMGDAGSRAIGIWLAIIAMKSQHPLSFLLLGLVFIIDGGLGLVKVFIIRFFKIKFLTNIRFPVHDQMRKNMGWKDVPVVLFMIGAEVVLVVIAGLLIRGI